MDHQVVVIVITLIGVLEADHLEHLGFVARKTGVFVHGHVLDAHALFGAGPVHAGNPNSQRAVGFGDRYAVGFHDGYTPRLYRNIEGLRSLEMVDVDIDRRFRRTGLGLLHAGCRRNSQHQNQ